jgi:hypothetical protein
MLKWTSLSDGLHLGAICAVVVAAARITFLYFGG